MAEISRENIEIDIPIDLSGPGVHVLDRFVDSHREAGSSRLSPHETNSMAFEKQLESTGIPRKGDSNYQVLAPTFAMVARRKERTHRPTVTPNKTCSANFYRCVKRRVGRSLKRAHCKRNLVTAGKQAYINYLELKAVFLALKVRSELCTTIWTGPQAE